MADHVNGESYKNIVAEAAKKAMGMDRIEERIFIVKLINDKSSKKWNCFKRKHVDLVDKSKLFKPAVPH